MDYRVAIKKIDWPMMLALAGLQGDNAPPYTLAEAIRYVHREAGGDDVELGSAGLDMSRWATAELLASGTWASAVLNVGDAGPVRAFTAWILRMVLFELACRIKESEPPKESKPPRSTGPLN